MRKVSVGILLRNIVLSPQRPARSAIKRGEISLLTCLFNLKSICNVEEPENNRQGALIYYDNDR